jgi:hypothetical protein
LLSDTSSDPLRSLRRIQNLISFHDPDFRVFFCALGFVLSLLRPLCNALVVAARVDPQYTAYIVAVARDREFAEGVAPFVEEAAYGLADFVFAVLRVVASAGDGVDRARG